MDDDGSEAFLSRWSRRKQEARETQEEQAAAPPPEPFDPESLPPLDSLGADSDYTGFLAGNVPPELRRLALRRAWASDPVIAGFRGFAEYDWDCNAPGYGALLPTDRIADLLDRIGGEDKTPEDAAVAEADEEDDPSAPEPPADGSDGPEDERTV
ncbi:DUF3306 domain-containing protein [Azospirillum isscasi]|uniref:DUF3306 domain-containing protein n=1 Tax=Azospirillum isscasi TaxID=3053926 RepID=A0ABU0WMZ0_9PROT|nr:DUF3306 domain-containing protein [Azospirillum isscasi]MDQ2105601.1 DUF3306 domain-containing protein [Azospirillum isscasi]